MNYRELRRAMVEEQIVRRGIKNQRVLQAFADVERHKFIPEELRQDAYSDFPLAIGEGQTISQPYIAALMTECLDLAGNEKVLEIGTGSGYQAAILAELAGEVYTIERFASLAKKAESVFKDLGCANIKIKVDDGTFGWLEAAPFERIIITAASRRIPLPLEEQLGEGGRLIAPLGEAFSQVLTLIKKKEGRLDAVDICGCVFVPLVGKHSHN